MPRRPRQLTVAQRADLRALRQRVAARNPSPPNTLRQLPTYRSAIPPARAGSHTFAVQTSTVSVGAPVALPPGPVTIIVQLPGKNATEKFAREAILFPNGTVNYVAGSKPFKLHLR